ncbi:hypothetical protein BDV93DRAFT_515916 [Ceratobasidium sp. AG-I]|nr:hypothetical protein BDV93DRAFT_515916 [Ceratobasidium sp. AG-I]
MCADSAQQLATVPVYKPIGRNFFPPAEQHFLMSKMSAFCQLNGKEAARVSASTSKNPRKSKQTVNQSSVFFGALLEEYKTRFPYRHPEANLSNCTPEQIELNCNVALWNRLSSKIHNWLQKKKPAEFKHLGKKKDTTGRESVNRPDNALPRLSDVYQLDWEKLQFTHGALDGLRNDTLLSWAEVTPESVQERQTNLASDLDDLTALVSRSTGAEIYSVAVWKDATGLHATDSQTKPVTMTDEAAESRDRFVEYVKRRVARATRSTRSTCECSREEGCFPDVTRVRQSLQLEPIIALCTRAVQEFA